MPKKISDVAVEKAPSLSSRISLFRSKLQISHYAPGSITDYCHALYKAVAFIGKLPEDFTQEDVDGYFACMLSRKPVPAEAQFKHFVYGLKCYRKSMGCSELQGLALPKIRREKKLPRILSAEQVMRLLRVCDLYFSWRTAPIVLIRDSFSVSKSDSGWLPIPIMYPRQFCRRCLHLLKLLQTAARTHS